MIPALEVNCLHGRLRYRFDGPQSFLIGANLACAYGSISRYRLRPGTDWSHPSVTGTPSSHSARPRLATISPMLPHTGPKLVKPDGHRECACFALGSHGGWHRLPISVLRAGPSEHPYSLSSR